MGAQETRQRRIEPRIERAARARQMRDSGIAYAAIAETLGISEGYVRDLLYDPDGSKARKRKEGYGAPCPRCGRRMSGNDGPNKTPNVCARCSSDEYRVWTRDTIVATFRYFHQVTGRTPTVVDVGVAPSWRQRISATRLAEIDEAPPLPSSNTVRERFGSWRAAVLAAGLEPAPNGAAGAREPPRMGPVQKQLLDLLREGPATVADLVSRISLPDARYPRTMVESSLRSLVARGLVTREKHKQPPRRRAYVYQLV